jgi:hypothetical protein
MVGWCLRQADDPTLQRFLRQRRLRGIAVLPDSKISRQTAEDALVLSRRLGDEKLAKRFAKLVASRSRTS